MGKSAEEPGGFDWTWEHSGATETSRTHAWLRGYDDTMTEKGYENLVAELQLCNQLACDTFIKIHLFNRYLWKSKSK